MSVMKFGINATMVVKISLDSTMSVEDIERIEFLFKQRKNHDDEELKKSVYESDGSGDVTREENKFYIPWTKDDTRKFAPGKIFFLDTRINFVGSDDNPITPILQLTMDDSLFGDEDE